MPCANSPDEPREHVAVDRDAAPLHPRERRDQRPLQRLVDRRHALGDEPRLQRRARAAASRRRPRRHIRVALSIGDAREADEVCARSRRPRRTDRLVAEPALGAARPCRGRRWSPPNRAHRRSASCRRSARPRCRAGANTCQSNFTFWPILSTPGVFEQRLQQRERLGLRDLAGRRARRRRTGRRSPATMAERDVAGLARRDGERDADEIGLHADRAKSSRCRRRRRPRLVRARDPARELGRASSRSRRRRRRTVPLRALAARCGGERLRGRRAARRAVAARRAAAGGRRPAAASFASPLRPRQPPGPTKAGSGSTAPASTPQISPTRRVIVVNSIAFRKAISVSPSSVGHAERRRAASRAATSRTSVTSVLEMRISSTVLGIGQRLAALGLLDLAGAREQRFEIAVFGDQLRGGLDADARRAGHVVGGIAGERLDVDDLVGAAAEIGDDLVGADPALLALARGRIEHRDARLDQLHQVLVGGDDQHVGAALARLRAHRSR